MFRTGGPPWLLFFLLFHGAGGGSQRLTHAKQGVCHCASPKLGAFVSCFVLTFEGRFTIALRQSFLCSPASAFWLVVNITLMCHQINSWLVFNPSPITISMNGELKTPPQSQSSRKTALPKSVCLCLLLSSLPCLHIYSVWVRRTTVIPFARVEHSIRCFWNLTFLVQTLKPFNSKLFYCWINFWSLCITCYKTWRQRKTSKTCFGLQYNEWCCLNNWGEEILGLLTTC